MVIRFCRTALWCSFLTLGLFVASASAQTACTPTVGPELTLTGTNWTLATGWSFMPSSLSPLKLRHVAGNALEAKQALTSSFQVGKSYQITFTISGYSGSGTITPYIGNSAGTAVFGNGTFRQSVYYSSGAAELRFVPSSDFSGYVSNDAAYPATRVSAKEVLAFSASTAASAPCLPDAALAFPMVWPDQNLQGIVNFHSDSGNPNDPGPFVKFMMNQLTNAPHTFVFNDPNGATSYVYYRPDLHRADNTQRDVTYTAPYALIVFKLSDPVTSGYLGKIEWGAQTAANLFQSGFAPITLTAVNYADAVSLKRTLGLLNVFYKYAKYFGTSCSTDSTKCTIACFDPGHKFTCDPNPPSNPGTPKNCTGGNLPNLCVDEYADAAMAADPAAAWSGRQFATWLPDSYLTTFKTIGKMKRTLAYLIASGDVPSCEDPTDACALTKPWNYSKLAAVTTVRAKQVSSLEWVHDIPWIKPEGLAAPSRTVEAVVPGTDTLTITDHRYSSGSELKLATTGALPGGLTSGIDYFAVKVDANHIKLANSYTNATAATPVVVDITNSGSGALTTTGSYLYVYGQGSPIDNGTITYKRSYYPDYPDSAHMNADYTFTAQSNGDQLLSHVNEYGGFMGNQWFYNPTAANPKCVTSSANGGDFPIEGNRCNLQFQWTYDKYPLGELAAGYPRFQYRMYVRGSAYSSRVPDRPWYITTNKQACGAPDPTAGGNCPDSVDTIDQYTYTTSDPSTYHHACRAQFTGGSVDGSMINVATDTLPVIRHGLRTGDKVQVYNPWDSYAIPGLTKYAWYYAIVVDANNIKLASSVANAQSGIAVDITGNRGCIPWYAWGDTNAFCGTVFVDSYDPIWGNTENRLLKRVEFYGPDGTTVTEGYDYIHEFDAPGQRCFRSDGIPTATPSSN